MYIVSSYHLIYLLVIGNLVIQFLIVVFLFEQIFLKPFKVKRSFYPLPIFPFFQTRSTSGYKVQPE